MNNRLLQSMLDDLPFSELSPAWNTFDLAGFSRDKTLWEYRQAALKALWR